MNYAGSAGAARSAVVCLNVQLLIQAREAHSHLSRVCLGGLGSVVLQGIPFDARVFVFLYMPFFLSLHILALALPDQMFGSWPVTAGHKQQV